MSLTTLVKQLFCRHEETATVGTGIFDLKRNREPLRFYPVTKFVCKKCKRVTWYIASAKKNI
jgi:hypothetical protein